MVHTRQVASPPRSVASPPQSASPVSTCNETRPKRSISVKNYNEEERDGMQWKEDRDLNKALYASLYHTQSQLDEAFLGPSSPASQYIPTHHQNKVHAQRKFASNVANPSIQHASPKRSTVSIPISHQVSFRPSITDFVTFVCLRGSPALPKHLEFFNYPGSKQQAMCTNTNDSLSSSDTEIWDGDRNLKAKKRRNYDKLALKSRKIDKQRSSTSRANTSLYKKSVAKALKQRKVSSHLTLGEATVKPGTPVRKREKKLTSLIIQRKEQNDQEKRFHGVSEGSQGGVYTKAEVQRSNMTNGVSVRNGRPKDESVKKIKSDKENALIADHTLAMPALSSRTLRYQQRLTMRKANRKQKTFKQRKFPNPAKSQWTAREPKRKDGGLNPKQRDRFKIVAVNKRLPNRYKKMLRKSNKNLTQLQREKNRGRQMNEEKSLTPNEKRMIAHGDAVVSVCRISPGSRSIFDHTYSKKNIKVKSVSPKSEQEKRLEADEKKGRQLHADANKEKQLQLDEKKGRQLQADKNKGKQSQMEEKKVRQSHANGKKGKQSHIKENKGRKLQTDRKQGRQSLVDENIGKRSRVDETKGRQSHVDKNKGKQLKMAAEILGRLEFDEKEGERSTQMFHAGDSSSESSPSSAEKDHRVTRSANRSTESKTRTVRRYSDRPVRQVRRNIRYRLSDDESDFIDIDSLDLENLDTSDEVRATQKIGQWKPRDRCPDYEVMERSVAENDKTDTSSMDIVETLIDLHVKQAGNSCSDDRLMKPNSTSKKVKSVSKSLKLSPQTSQAAARVECVASSPAKGLRTNIKPQSFYSETNMSLPTNSPKKKPPKHASAQDPAFHSLCFPSSTDGGHIVDIPVFYPTPEQFHDPLEYMSSVRHLAEPFGMCRIVPPKSWKPESYVNGELRFASQHQYLHKMHKRWGPNVQKLECVKKHLQSLGVNIEQPPMIGGVEVDLPKLSRTIQSFGGLKNVTEKKTIIKVADVMKIPKSALDRGTKLYDIYCKYLLSYDTLPEVEKQKVEHEVLSEHLKKSKNLDEVEDCIVKGKSMNVSMFSRIALNTHSMWFKENCEPSPEQVENEYWNILNERTNHVMVQCGHIDTAAHGSAFPSRRDSPFFRHGWNFNILCQNQMSILKCLGSVKGLTTPTLHAGMLFTSSCWSTDHHFIPYIQYLHSGADLIWYAIPETEERKFQAVMREIVPDMVYEEESWLPEDTVMLSPDVLRAHGISLGRSVQCQGQFTVVFTKCYTATISCGYNISESVHFAFADWIPYAVQAHEMLYKCCEQQMFSLHQLLCMLAQFYKMDINLLKIILPHLKHYINEECSLRMQIESAGLLPSPEPLPKHTPQINVPIKKRHTLDEMNNRLHVCDISKAICYLSVVLGDNETYSIEQALVCRRKKLKQYKLYYRYSLVELMTLIRDVQDAINLAGKTPPKSGSADTPMRRQPRKSLDGRGAS